MTKNIQIRGVPDEVHRRLLDEARSRDTSLSAYLRERLASLPGSVRNAEILRRAAARDVDVSSGAILTAIDEGRAQRTDRIRASREQRSSKG